MRTTEIINGKKVEINWELTEIIERHDSDFCEWAISGMDIDGNEYEASCWAFGDGSEASDVHDIEEI